MSIRYQSLYQVSGVQQQTHTQVPAFMQHQRLSVVFSFSDLVNQVFSLPSCLLCPQGVYSLTLFQSNLTQRLVVNNHVLNRITIPLHSMEMWPITFLELERHQYTVVGPIHRSRGTWKERMTFGGDSGVASRRSGIGSWWHGLCLSKMGLGSSLSTDAVGGIEEEFERYQETSFHCMS